VTVRILIGDARSRLSELLDQSVNCVVTSPPYFGLRDYQVAGQIGLEPTPDAYVDELVSVFRGVRRVLRDDGTVWLNLGDSYVSVGNGAQGVNGEMATRRVAQVRDRKAVHGSGERPPSVPNLPPKNLIGIPWRVAFALQADGWFLRQDIIWAKPNPMPESVRDRCTKAHEYIFLLSKRERYHFDADAIAEPAIYAGDIKVRLGSSKDFDIIKQRTHPTGSRVVPETRNRRSVWTIASEPFSDAHFATFPPSLVEPCILAGCPKGGTVLDPFGGAGTTALVADRLGRNAILIELNPSYAAMARARLERDAGMFASVRAEHLEAAE
jgi:DNA modification methylase